MTKHFRALFLSFVWLAASLPVSVFAQNSYTQAELDQMIAPVALYPDSLLSQILMASTYPDQMQEAARWSANHPDDSGDEAVRKAQGFGWEASVVSLVAFPQFLAMAAEQPLWIEQMGDAFLVDPDAVMDTVQRLRRKANQSGNLKTTEQQRIVITEAPDYDDTIIVIEPARPQVVYVPVYNPVVVYGDWWWPSYRPFYYKPVWYSTSDAFWAGVGFGLGMAVTHSLWSHWDWHDRDINVNVYNYNNINIHNHYNEHDRHSWKRDTVDRRKVYLESPKHRDYMVTHEVVRDKNLKRDNALKNLEGHGIDVGRSREDLKGVGGDKTREKIASEKLPAPVPIKDKKPTINGMEGGYNNTRDKMPAVEGMEAGGSYSKQKQPGVVTKEGKPAPMPYGNDGTGSKTKNNRPMIDGAEGGYSYSKPKQPEKNVPAKPDHSVERYAKPPKATPARPDYPNNVQKENQPKQQTEQNLESYRNYGAQPKPNPQPEKPAPKKAEQPKDKGSKVPSDLKGLMD